MRDFKINVSNIEGTILGAFDLSSDSEINIIYELADIKEPEKRSGNYSLPFTIPGSKNNNQILQPLFENGFSVTNFNPNRKLFADIILDNQQVFAGQIQITDVIKNGTKIDYQLQLNSYFSSLFEDIGSETLTNTIDLSKYNHPWDREHIVKSWDTAIKVNGGWQGFSKGTGYVYPHVHQGETNNFYKITSFKPWVYASTILDEVLNRFGYKYKSSFLNSDSFKSLIISPNPEGDKLLEELLTKNTFRYELSTERELTTSLVSTVAEVKKTGYGSFDTQISDVLTTYDPLTSTWTVPKNGEYQLLASFRLITQYTFPTFGTYLINSKPVPCIIRFVNQNKTVIYEKTVYFYDSGTKHVGASYREGIDVYIDFTSNFNKSDRIQMQLEWKIPTTPAASRVTAVNGSAVKSTIRLYMGTTLSDNTTSRFYNVLSSEIAQDDVINLNRFLPDMQTKDFITGINKMFNLYWQRQDDNTYIIEPRDDFYSADSKVVDISKHIIRDEDYKITPLSEFVYNEYKFTYKEDSDFWNTKYTKDYKKIYGEKIVNVDSDFATNRLEVTLPFSPTPLYKPFKLTNKTVSSFFTEEDDTRVAFSPATRILFYNGLIPIENYKVSDSIYITKKADGTSINIYIDKYKCFEYTYSSYAYAGHLYDYRGSSLDLNFGICDTYYFPFTQFSNDTLFNRFWRNYILEITDQDSHLLTVKVQFNSYDINEFNLRYIYQVDNVYYRVNKFTFNPLTNIGEIELYKALDYQPFIPSVIQNTSTGTVWGTGNSFPAPSRPTFNGGVLGYQPLGVYTNGNIPSNPQFQYSTGLWQDSESYYSSVTNTSFNDRVPTYRTNNENITDANGNRRPVGARVRGNNNTVDTSSTNVNIQGDNNTIMSDTSNVTIVGKNNTILSSVTNVTIIGDNQIVDKSNYSYINGIEVIDGKQKTRTPVIRSTSNAQRVITSGIDSTSNYSCIYKSR